MNKNATKIRAKGRYKAVPELRFASDGTKEGSKFLMGIPAACSLAASLELAPLRAISVDPPVICVMEMANGATGNDHLCHKNGHSDH
ncbi:unnamed protein product [Rotaria socialis]|uniref:Uncharacterized protein n=1 Tax=Rotaria socialis TaxID=392032 RepID=A0A820QTZ1_9BILA|nr:unnamed protein product [Rotaria socialis]